MINNGKSKELKCKKCGNEIDVSPIQALTNRLRYLIKNIQNRRDFYKDITDITQDYFKQKEKEIINKIDFDIDEQVEYIFKTLKMELLRDYDFMKMTDSPTRDAITKEDK